MPRDLLLRRYPPFVTGGPLPAGHVPVFCFHGLEPESFGRRLAYLADNGYVSLSADEYFEVVTGRRPAPPRAVVLTFDDGRSSVRTVGWPLMRRHGFKGVVFVVPGRTASRPGPLPATLDDVEAGRATLAGLLEREEGPDAFLTWEEMQQLQGTGLFDFQSHSLSHARVHVGPELVGFLEPSLLRGYGPLDVPLLAPEGRDLFAPEAPLGTPLLRYAPRLGEVTRFHEDGDLARACAAHVGEHGGPRFFERPDWPAALRALAERIPCAAAWRARPSAWPPCGASWSSRAPSWSSASAGRPSTSATPGTWPGRRPGSWPARPATAAPTAARCAAFPSRCRAATRCAWRAWARTTSSCCPAADAAVWRTS